MEEIQERGVPCEATVCVPLSLLLGCFLAAFLLYAFVIVFFGPADRLTGDEIFYFFQAKHLRSGEFVWFEDTQPYLYPVFLALTFLDDITAMRMANAAVMALSGVLAGLLGARIAGRAGFWCVFLLFALHPRTLHLGTSLFVESLFVALQAALLLMYDTWWKKEVPAWSSSLSLGILLGLVLECRPVGLLLVPPLLVEGIFQYNRQRIRHLLLILFIAFLLALPYGLLHASSFLGEKLGALSGNLLLKCEALIYVVPRYFGLPVLALFLGFSSWRFRLFRHPVIRYMSLYGFLYFVVTILFDKYFFSRHLYPLVMLLACLTVASLPFLSSRVRTLFFCCVLAVASWELVMGLKLQPIVYSNSYFFVSDSRSAVDVSSFEVVSGPEQGKIVNLPYFSQPNRSRATYRAVINTRHRYEVLVISYVSDYVKVQLDGLPLTSNNEGSPFEPFELEVSVPTGRHVLDIEIRNNDNIGGMGQVLLSTKDFVEASVRRYTWHEL